MAVGRDNLETELFVIVDLDRVWVDLAVSPADLTAVKEGQPVVVTTRAIKDRAQGEIVFISPALDKETRSARVIAEIANPAGIWRPGSFVTGMPHSRYCCVVQRTAFAAPFDPVSRAPISSVM